MSTTITIQVPEGVEVRIVRVPAGTSERPAPASSSASGGPTKAPPEPLPPGARGHADGSASQKQRSLIRARCRSAGLDVQAACDFADVPTVNDLGWADVDVVLGLLASRSTPAAAPAPAAAPPLDAAAGDEDIPF